MIPKIIHYCWFGKNKLPRTVKKCIKSWKKYCNGYKIKLWNETNFSLDNAPQFVKSAYEHKKWAFVSDYVRLYVVNQEGGLYLDTDVEILKPWDELLKYKAFFGREISGNIATGLGFGAEPHNELLDYLLQDYENLEMNDNDDFLLKIACPELNKHVFDDYGFSPSDSVQIINGIAVYPERFFCPIDSNCTRNLKCDETYSIHHYSASWLSNDYRKKNHKKRMLNIVKRSFNQVVHIPNIVLKKLIGIEKYNDLKRRNGR